MLEKFGVSLAAFLMIWCAHLLVFGRINKKNPLLFSPFNRTFLGIAGLFALIFLSGVLPDPARKNQEAVAFRKNENNSSYEQLTRDFEKNIASRTRDFAYQQRFIDALYSLEFDDPFKKAEVDNFIINHYSRYWTMQDSAYAHAGAFGLGYYYYLRNDYEAAIRNWKEIASLNIPGVYGRMGISAVFTGDTSQAITWMHQELVHTSGPELVMPFLEKSLFETGRYAELNKLAFTYSNLQYMDVARVQESMLKAGNIMGYYYVLFANMFSSLYWFGILAALLISIIYLGYWIRIDVYMPMPRLRLLGIFLAGILLAPLVVLVNDLLLGIWPFPGSGEKTSFLSLMVQVGLAEELVKLLPLGIALLWKQNRQEPLHILKLACAGALGFAFTENLLYFTEDKLNIIFVRGIVATMIHMVTTCAVAYALVLNRFKYQGKKAWLVAAAFAGAVLFHTVYDYLLQEGDTVKSLKLLVGLMWIMGIYLFSLMVNNGLNQSPYFSYAKRLNNARIADYLAFSFTCLLAAQFIFMFLNRGTIYAQNVIAASITGNGLFLFVLAYLFSNIDVIKGYWEPVQPHHIFRKRDRNQCMDQEVALVPHAEHDNPMHLPPMRGHIFNRMVYPPYHHFFKVNLQEFHHIDDVLFIKPEVSFETINNRQAVLVGLYAFMQHEGQERPHFEKIGMAWAKCS